MSTITKMENLISAVIKPLSESKYMKPLTFHFNHNGTQRTWDFLVVHDSVAIILHNITRNVLIFVKQFRPPVYVGSIPKEDRQGEIDVTKYPANLGVTLELCAGIIDKPLSPVEIAAEEVLEECGYKVEPSMLQRVSSYRSGVGTSGSTQYLYYCEVTDDMKVNEGGGVDDEIIEVVEMSIPEVKEFMGQEHIRSPPSFLFALTWFFLNKCK